MWPFRRGKHDDEDEYEEYSSYEEYTDDEEEYEEHEEEEERGDEVEEEEDHHVAEEQYETDNGEEESTSIEKEAAPLKDDDAPLQEEPHDAESEEGELVVVNQEDIGTSFEETDEEEEHSDEEEEVSLDTGDELGKSFETDEVDDESHEVDEESDDDDEEQDDEAESLLEKQSLLALAAEHDRVDILKAILAESDTSQEDRHYLLNSASTVIPPLHVAVSYGSTHATSCLLRMGANPAIWPNVSEILRAAAAAAGNDKKEQTTSASHMARYDDVSAWELAFGREPVPTKSKKGENKDDVSTEEEPEQKKKGWFGWGGSKEKTSPAEEEEVPAEPAPPASKEETTATGSIARCRSSASVVKPVDMAPSKREGIRHAFTAEALRCIGSDEVERLQQLLDSGMPASIDIGGKTLHGWCVEMGALHCEVLIRPEETQEEEEEESVTAEDKDENGQTEEAAAAAVISPAPMYAGSESLATLCNRLEELDSLAAALSSCLDNLAEEVSVCHGLLLLGGGASALAAHVRSLNALQNRRQDELEHWSRLHQEKQDELDHWIRKCGGEFDVDLPASTLGPRRSSSMPLPETAEEEEAQRRQLLAQLAASENKVRKLRASITDLSEENTRDLAEVEKRGLTGGIKLVRTLREELREVEFSLSEAKSGEAACRTRISLIQSRMEAAKKKNGVATTSEQQEPVMIEKVEKNGNSAVASSEAGGANVTLVAETPEPSSNGTTMTHPDSCLQAKPTPESANVSRALPQGESREGGLVQEPASRTKSQSEAIAAGESDAIVVRQPGARYLPVDLWDILLRIIGLGRDAVKRSTDNLRGSASSVMIV